MIDLHFWTTPNGYKPLLFLEEAGLDRRSPDPDGGVLRRGPDGELTGVLEETAMHFVDERVLSPGPLEALQIQ